MSAKGNFQNSAPRPPMTNWKRSSDLQSPIPHPPHSCHRNNKLGATGRQKITTVKVTQRSNGTLWLYFAPNKSHYVIICCSPTNRQDFCGVGRGGRYVRVWWWVDNTEREWGEWDDKVKDSRLGHLKQPTKESWSKKEHAARSKGTTTTTREETIVDMPISNQSSGPHQKQFAKDTAQQAAQQGKQKQQVNKLERDEHIHIQHGVSNGPKERMS